MNGFQVSTFLRPHLNAHSSAGLPLSTSSLQWIKFKTGTEVLTLTVCSLSAKYGNSKPHVHWVLLLFSDLGNTQKMNITTQIHEPLASNCSNHLRQKSDRNMQLTIRCCFQNTVDTIWRGPYALANSGKKSLTRMFETVSVYWSNPITRDMTTFSCIDLVADNSHYLFL